MKKLFLFIVLISLIFVSNVFSADYTLSLRDIKVTFEKSTDQRVTSHKIYYNTGSVEKSVIVPIDKNYYIFTKDNFTPLKEYTFTATALGKIDNVDKESVRSNAVTVYFEEYNPQDHVVIPFIIDIRNK